MATYLLALIFLRGAASTALGNQPIALIHNSKENVVQQTASDQEIKALQVQLEKAMLDLYLANAQKRLGMSAQHNAPAPATAPSPAPSPQAFGALEPFGREDTARELTEASIEESNKMVDQVERAVVSETKRSMFRALTRLRGATIAAYDGVANSQAANIHNYAMVNHWRDDHKQEHLAEQESDYSEWAFPNGPEPAYDIAQHQS